MSLCELMIAGLRDCGIAGLRDVIYNMSFARFASVGQFVTTYVPASEPVQPIQGYLFSSNNNGSAGGTISNGLGNAFTIEFYYRKTVSNTGAINILTIGNMTKTLNTKTVCVLCGNAGEFQLTSGELSSPALNVYANTGITTTNTWNHIAFVIKPNSANSASSVKLFVNGINTSLTTTSATSILNISDTNIRLGQQTGSTTFGRFKGNNINITNIRVTTKEVYTNNFTPVYRKLYSTQSERLNVASIHSSECVLLMQVNTDGTKLKNEITGSNLTDNTNMVFGTTTIPPVS